MHSFTDPNKYKEAVFTELAKTHTWTRQFPDHWLLHLMNDVKASPIHAAFIIATSFNTVRPKKETPKLANKLQEECAKRCKITQQNVQAEVTNVMVSGEEAFITVAFWKNITILTPQEVKQIDKTIHPQNLKEIGENLDFFPTCVMQNQQLEAIPFQPSSTKGTRLAFMTEFIAPWPQTQSLLITVENVKKQIVTCFDTMINKFEQIEQMTKLTAHKQIAAKELAVALVTAKLPQNLL